jgi:hypothetical protein
MEQVTTAREIVRADFAAAIAATTTKNLVWLAGQYAEALAFGPVDLLADVAANLATVASEIERRTRR